MDRIFQHEIKILENVSAKKKNGLFIDLVILVTLVSVMILLFILFR